MIRASAPGKVILLGEHAVVYGRPAIAVPVAQVRAEAALQATPPGSGLTVVALDLERSLHLASASLDDPLAAIACLTLARLDLEDLDGLLTISSTIPIAGGMGSGAAVSTAIVRAIAAFVGADLTADEVSALVFEVEKLYHGTPSGIDNTVVGYEQPVVFVRGRPPELLAVGAPLHLLVADSGVAASTRQVVAGVRQRWEADPARYEWLFDQIGLCVVAARRAFEAGDAGALGALMDRNHALLVEMGVSSPALERLVQAARGAGALGAKLSGAGAGGNVVALAEPDTVQVVERALQQAGAVRTIAALVTPNVIRRS